MERGGCNALFSVTFGGMTFVSVVSEGVSFAGGMMYSEDVEDDDEEALDGDDSDISCWFTVDGCGNSCALGVVTLRIW